MISTLQFLYFYFLLLKISQASNFNAQKCLEEVLRQSNIKGENIGFFHSSMMSSKLRSLSQNIPPVEPSHILSHLMNAHQASFRVFSENLVRILPVDQQKNHDFQAMILWLEVFNNIDFTKIIKTIKSYRVIGPDTKIIVVIRRTAANTDAAIIENIFLNLWEILRSFYCLVILIEVHKASFYSFDPYGNNFTRNKINKRRDGLQPYDSFFAVLPTNFEGYNFHVGYTSRPPYIIVSSYPPVGSEIKQVQTIAKHLNISLHYTMRNDSELVAIKDDEYNGLFKLLYDNELDIVTVSTGIFPEYFPASSPLGLHDVTLLRFLTKEPQPVGSINWNSFFGTFSIGVWVSIILCVICVSTLVFITSQLKSDKKLTFVNSILTVVNLHFDVPISFQLLRHTSKIFLSLLLLYLIIISSLVKSIFTTLHTIPSTAEPIHNVDEAIAAGLTFYFLPSVFNRFKGMIPLLLNQILETKNYVINANFTEHVYQGAVTGKGVIACYKTVAQYVVNERLSMYGNNHFVKTFDDTLMDSYLFTYLSPGNPVHKIFYKLQSWLQSGGFIDHWSKSYLLNMVKNNDKLILSHGPKTLTLKEVVDVFFLMLIFLTFACMIFIIEVIYHRVFRKKEPKNCVVPYLTNTYSKGPFQMNSVLISFSLLSKTEKVPSNY